MVALDALCAYECDYTIANRIAVLLLLLDYFLVFFNLRTARNKPVQRSCSIEKSHIMRAACVVVIYFQVWVVDLFKK
jgi:hypothetical protein